ncbi:unnamed protein product [Moneuplotes crassus]|uniref:Calmodulin n=1 Tax=Euplotes crassus TaxID=5936 RepID=A0AAD1Y5M5_EUPCR|nr:unnamed protein product [Moneuplotes crassus]
MESPQSADLSFERLTIPDFSEIESEQFKREAVVPYFRDIYKDLASRSDNKAAGINKVTIIEYCHFPGVLADRFFSLLDDNKDEYIDVQEFIYVLFQIYYSQFDEQVKLVFEIYDFDCDGYITKEDVRIILSYIPILKDVDGEEKVKEGAFSQSGETCEGFDTRIKIQEEISELLDLAFKDKDSLNLDEFQEINETISSDMLVIVLTLIKEKLPCSEKFYKIQQEFLENKEQEEMKRLNTRGLCVETRSQKSIPTPNILKSLSPLAQHSCGDLSSPVSHLRKVMTQDTFGEFTSCIKEKDIDLKKFGSKNKKDGEDSSNSTKEESVSPTTKHDLVRLANKASDPKSLLGKDRRNLFASPTSFLKGTKSIKEENESSPTTKEAIEHEGEMMRQASKDRYKKYYYRLFDKEFYVYKTQKDKVHKTMINLIGVFLRVEKKEPLDQKNVLYPFTLIFPNKERTFFLLSKKSRDEWVAKIKKAIGYAHLYDYYEVKHAIGKGKFGTIKLGVHLKTGKKVAIKIMRKKNMSMQDIVMQKREIEILKICQHPSIIRLLDLFENHDYIYIVMEYCKGGDLFTYLEKRNFKIPESKASELSHSITTGIFYLHSFGIAHRDLKPENILMTDDSDDATPKLVDFGLSKIIGPKETCNDPFGTLSYVAPEVLLQKPYDKSVDLWSLGVIIYLLISGTLPFDDEDDREIARQTLQDEPDFSYKIWKKKDKATIELVSSLLEKEKDDRMDLSSVLQHPWILNKSEKIALQRRNSGDSSAAKFKAFAMTEDFHDSDSK